MVKRSIEQNLWIKNFEALGGTRLDRLYEVRPQDRVQRRTVEQIVGNTLIMPSLDVPVPQMEIQLAMLGTTVDTCVAADLDPEAFFSIRFEWRSTPSRCFWLQSCSARFALGKLEVLLELHVTDSGDDGQHFSRSARIFRTPPLGVESLVVLPINPQRLLTKTLCLEARVKQQQQQQQRQQQ